jgi:hypothetical protein
MSTSIILMQIARGRQKVSNERKKRERRKQKFVLSKNRESKNSPLYQLKAI